MAPTAAAAAAAAAPSPPPDPGAKYELRQQIGRGSFGAAFLVTNRHDKRDYVLKRVRLAKQSAWQRGATRQERELTAGLHHPFIASCLESWLVGDHTVNTIYAYCEGGDLASHLARAAKAGRQLDEATLRRWLCQLLLALDHLQTHAVLHRDIKTSNLLLTRAGDVQLADFGLATRMTGDNGSRAGSRPADSNLVGTPHFMSPELLSCKAYGFKTDVWSLGCVFYELTAQRPPYNAFNISGLVTKIRRHKLAPLPAEWSEEWREVVGLMLIKNPERRPSVQELMALPALRPALLDARARAQQLMPDVRLPPLLEPTPFAVSRATLSGSCSDAGTDSSDADAAAAAAGGCSGSWHGSGGAAAADAAAQDLVACEGGGVGQPQPQPQQPAAVMRSAGSSRRCSSSSRGSSNLGGRQALLPCTPPGAAVLDGLLSKQQQVRQPGIHHSPSQRVAAAIAAGRPAAAAAAAATGPQEQQAAGRGVHAAGGARSAVPRLQLPAATTPPATGGQGRPASSRSCRQEGGAGADGSSRRQQAPLSARPASARGLSQQQQQQQQRPAWNSGSAGRLQQRLQQPTPRAPGTAGRLAVAAAAKSAAAAAAGKAQQQAAAAAGGFLGALRQQAADAGQQQQQQCRQAGAEDISALTAHQQQHWQQQQQQQQQQRSAVVMPASISTPGELTDDDDDSSSCCGSSAVKQLRYDSASPAAVHVSAAAGGDADGDGSSTALWALAASRPGSASGVRPAAAAAAAAAVTLASTGAAEAAGSSIIGQQPQQQQRLELLESVLQLAGSLYARGRWQELGAVLCSPGLLPGSHELLAAAQAGRLPPPPGAAAAAGSGGSSAAHIQLGDAAVLGSRRAKGRIGYLGPVAWDPSGDDWVGIQLDSPRGTDGSQGGISYLPGCLPGCASFSRASQLMSAAAAAAGRAAEPDA